MDSRLILASALTKIHPGAGRAPGVVDLPVVRDPLGIWYIPGSQLKGSIKTCLILGKGCMLSHRSINSKIIECLLGSEEAARGASAIALTDLYPLFVPAPSSKHGVIYVTGRILLTRALQAAEAVGSDFSSFLKGLLKAVKEGSNTLINNVKKGGESGSLYVGGRLIQYQSSEGQVEIPNDMKKLSSLYNYTPLDNRILVVNDGLLPNILDSLLIRQTRVRLDPMRKTVMHGPWTEEYIPWGTLFIGLV